VGKKAAVVHLVSVRGTYDPIDSILFLFRVILIPHTLIYYAAWLLILATFLHTQSTSCLHFSIPFFLDVTYYSSSKHFTGLDWITPAHLESNRNPLGAVRPDL